MAENSRNRTASKQGPPADPDNSRPNEAKAPSHTGSEQASFRVVAIGASAGGLEAVTGLLDALPGDTGMAYILVQHQSIQGQHLLPSLLAEHTTMPVIEAAAGTPVEPNHLYINPPDSGLILEQGTLKTYLRPTEHEHPDYIDVLFESVAREKQALAVGILLSGLASDGVNGIRKIQQAGGITFAQNTTARFNDLPANAIANTEIDFILPVKEVAAQLAFLAGLPLCLKDHEGAGLPAFAQDYLLKVLDQVKLATRINFSEYKIKTLQRRLWRRMLLSRITDPTAYLDFLGQHPQEAHLLASDFLINVTSFFREPDVFQVLKDKVFPAWVKRHSPDQPFRIWVPACATGEEAYSIGMAYLEFMENTIPRPKLQIFATDLSEEAINRARRGLYPERALETVSPDRRKRFFTKADGVYQVSRAVRDLCIFAVQNVLTDPPISHVDLISCCNLFIYISDHAQRQVVKTFHQALSPDGYLVLGNAESMPFAADLFALVDGRAKIYQKKFFSMKPPVTPSPLEPAKMRHSQRVPNLPEALTPLERVKSEADRLLLAQYTPAGFLVDNDLNIVQFRGDTGPYLHPANDVPSFQLNKIARPELLTDLLETIDQARLQRVPIKKDKIQLLLNGKLSVLSLSVIPLLSEGAIEDYFLILLMPLTASPLLEQDIAPEPGAQDEGSDLRQLKHELAAARHYIQNLTEKHNAVTEELHAAIEELKSNNEELQSTVEELESTKEELQSNYEELNSINEELHAKNNVLIEADDDLNNLLTSINLSFIFLDDQGRIRRFSDKATDIFNLIGSDVGRPLSDIKPNVELPPLDPLTEETMTQLKTKILTVRDHQGKEFLLKTRPYKTSDNRIKGVVLIIQEK
jgi:two-component system, chemotaxis family, CheB/CheR fusion protein